MQGNAKGDMRGGYAYLDPNNEWQTVKYVADENGFRVKSSALPIANPVAHPQDTFAVAKAKAYHENLYKQIALTNSKLPEAPRDHLRQLQDTAEVANSKDAFQKQFEKIRAEHSRIAEEHKNLAELEEKERETLEE